MDVGGLQRERRGLSPRRSLELQGDGALRFDGVSLTFHQNRMR